MAEIIPAVMPKSFRALQDAATLLSPFASRIQLDVMDGKFVPEKTWPYLTPADADFAAILAEDRGLPGWESIDYEVDLMSAAPETDAFDWVKAGAARIVLHFESTGELEKLVGEMRSEFGAPGSAAFAPEIGISALNGTGFSEWSEFVPLFDFVQVMGIDRIGYQGEPFDERALMRIKEIRAAFPEIPISVDGAVSLETAPSLIAAGAARLVAGSAILRSDNPKGTYDALSRL